MYNEEIINETLNYTRDEVGNIIKAIIEQKRDVPGAYEPLYAMLSDYPFRKGKALRPALCVSTCRAAGGFGHLALISSAAIELYHNAFLIHDDIEDESEHRRGKKTLHSLVGIARAVNAGDATNVLAVSLLLENLNSIGVGKSLHVIHEIENMARQSVEGQSMELDWIANNVFDLQDEDYYTMCAKKTCWYTFIAPCRIGYICGNPVFKEQDVPEHLAALTSFGMSLGIAFQIQDDLLNLVGSEEKYGKEIAGDIYEGKRTIMLNHLIAHSGKNRDHIVEILMKPRSKKIKKEVQFILKEMRRCKSIEYGQQLAIKQAGKAMELLNGMDFLLPSTPIIYGEKWKSEIVDKRFITELVNYVIQRNL